MSSGISSGLDRQSVRQRGRPKREIDDSVSDEAKTKLDENAVDGSLISDVWKFEAIVGPIILTVLAWFTRVYQIAKSNNVVWDEAHFGKFGSYYLKREYYFDVHPPLGKMLVGLSGYLVGYNGSFGFESGSQYPAEVDYVNMRVFNSLFNAACVPLAYFTAKTLKFRLPTVWLISLMLLLEHSYITLGRFILLDSMLAFFTVSTFACLAKFHTLQGESFSRRWWAWLFLMGLSIGCVSSVKMVGLFVTSLVGIYTVADLWIKFADTKMPFTTYMLHWIARIFNLIVVPLLVFMAAFKVHFMILTHSGPGDSNMSSLFQANLIGNEVASGPVDVTYGSKVTFRAQGLNGGLLHSHVQTYPDGSEQQQVTTYHHKDANNEWLIDYARVSERYYSEEDPIQFLVDGDVVRLMHPMTGRNLHTHKIPAPLTKSKYEVSCYGNLTIGDEKDDWTVEIVENPGLENVSRVHPLSTAIRLKNEAMNCYLSSEGNNLPAWGFRQGEVTCNPRATKRDKRTWWNVEQHENGRLNDTSTERILPKTSFLRDFIQLNFAMMATNNALIADPDKIDDLASKAWEWPILHVGLRLCGWGKDNVKYFLLGHPTTTWLSTAGLVALGLITVIYILRWQRQYADFDSKKLEYFVIAGILPALGWFLHYLPFLIMARITYVHHYLPALYFAIVTFGFLVEYISIYWIRNKYIVGFIYFTLYAVTIGIFFYFAPISYGMVGDSSDFRYLNWFKTWRIV